MEPTQPTEQQETWGIPRKTLEGRDATKLMEKYGFKIVRDYGIFFVVKPPENARLIGLDSDYYLTKVTAGNGLTGEVYIGDRHIFRIHVGECSSAWVSDPGEIS